MGTGPWSLYRFSEKDHLPLSGATGSDLKSRLQTYLESQSIRWDGSRASLVTQLRFLGYVFNPVSFYFCWNADGKIAAALAEVGNTFGEIKLYALGPEHWKADSVTESDGEFRFETPKFFYVSPFSTLTSSFDFRLRPPSEKLFCRVDTVERDQKILIATLSGTQAPLNRRHLFLMTLRFPFVTLGIISAIHWNALLLFLKRIPYFKKAQSPENQRGALRLKT
jgi:DUF1365 family protein